MSDSHFPPGLTPFPNSLAILSSTQMSKTNKKRLPQAERIGFQNWKDRIERIAEMPCAVCTVNSKKEKIRAAEVLPIDHPPLWETRSRL
jgi:hypothetical protein